MHFTSALITVNDLEMMMMMMMMVAITFLCTLTAALIGILSEDKDLLFHRQKRKTEERKATGRNMLKFGMNLYIPYMNIFFLYT